MVRGRCLCCIRTRWSTDLAHFSGLNLLLAETSATSGGLDSLLAPVRTLKKAQDLAARAFGAKHTFFVTNRTSTANKIVHQALVSPNEACLLYTYPSPRDRTRSRMPSSA